MSLLINDDIKVICGYLIELRRKELYRGNKEFLLKNFLMNNGVPLCDKRTYHRLVNFNPFSDDYLYDVLLKKLGLSISDNRRIYQNIENVCIKLEKLYEFNKQDEIICLCEKYLAKYTNSSCIYLEEICKMFDCIKSYLNGDLRRMAIKLNHIQQVMPILPVSINYVLYDILYDFYQTNDPSKLEELINNKCFNKDIYFLFFRYISYLAYNQQIISCYRTLEGHKTEILETRNNNYIAKYYLIHYLLIYQYDRLNLECENKEIKALLSNMSSDEIKGDILYNIALLMYRDRNYNEAYSFFDSVNFEDLKLKILIYSLEDKLGIANKSTIELIEEDDSLAYFNNYFYYKSNGYDDKFLEKYILSIDKRKIKHLVFFSIFEEELSYLVLTTQNYSKVQKFLS
ncbi:MAG: hypothetical protein IKM20_00915 [Erysipelotrichales bacterium]|nr:hypothetical protein [Erysipelotrichales bacterium]